MGKKILKSLAMLIGGIIISTVLILAVFSLPTNRMKENVKQSLKTFEVQGTYYEPIVGYIGSRLDNFTDSIMLRNVVSNVGSGIVDRAMNVYMILYDDKNQEESLIAYVNGEEGEKLIKYPRYWHGYLTVLKPLFMFFNYSEIKLLNMSVQLALIFAIIVMLVKRNMSRYMFPFFMTYIYLCPIALAMSLQFTTIFYITFLALLVMLCNHERFNGANIYYLFFLVIGMCTSFFDFLTYPLVTLGIPLTFYFILLDNYNFKTLASKLFELCCSWGGGYLGMWGGKWLVASILTGDNVFLDAYRTILIRTSTETSTGSISYSDTILRNCNVLLSNKLFVCIMFIIVLYCLLSSIKRKINYKKMAIFLLPFVIIMFMPFVWYLLANNHSYIHFWYVYRVLSIFVFAFLSMFIKLMEAK